MDYLEGKIEQFQAQFPRLEKENQKLLRQIETSNDKLKLIKDQKDRDAKDFSKTIAALQSKLLAEKDRVQILESKFK